MNGKLYCRAKDDDDESSRPRFVNLEELKNVPHVNVPSTAQEYLVTVITERNNVEEVTQCNIDCEIFRKNQSLFFDEEPLPEAPDKLKPTKEWQNIQIADFSEVRSYVSRMRNEANGTKRIKPFIVGTDNLYWWRYMFYRFDPNLSLILGFSAAQLDKALEYLVQILKSTNPGQTVDECIGRWIYAALSCVKLPLHSDTVCLIRDLAKESRILRSRIDPESDDASSLAIPFTLIICIVGRYFGQRDLADSLD